MKRLYHLFASYFDANRRNYTPLGIKQGSNNGIIPDQLQKLRGKNKSFIFAVKKIQIL